MGRSDRLAFVSVVFEAELALLEVQARSLAEHLPAALVEEIVVIDNTARGLRAPARDRLVRLYGPHAPLVRVLRPDDICHVRGGVGWRRQQVLKLAVAARLSTRHYVVLDAKNHAVRRLRHGDFVADDGRPRAHAYGYDAHPLRPALEHVLTYLGVDPAPHVGRFTATVTPFVLDVDTVRAVIRDVEQRSGRRFAEEFIARDLTEFFLYAGWVVREGGSIEEVHSLDLVPNPTVWPKAAHRDGVLAAVAVGLDRDAPFFSVHRRALAALDEPARAALADLWVARGLFPAAPDAAAFIAAFQRAFAAEVRAQWWRDLPHAAVAAPRRVRRVVRRTVARRRRGRPLT